MRLIDADTLLKEWRLECGGACFIRKDKYCMHYDRTKGVCTLIIKAPTIEPIKHGRWIEYNHYVECPLCHRKWNSDYNDIYAFNYCPNCGSRMDEVKE